jgi:N utilization substance protein B
MNEYIDLSKFYSTPKSGEFINGILDSILKKLKEENRIEKTGRGIVEN